MSVGSETARCPGWCDGNHPLTPSVHSGEIVTVRLSETLAVQLMPVVFTDPAAVPPPAVGDRVVLMAITDEEKPGVEMAWYLPADTAGQFAAGLAKAAGAAGADTR